MSHDDVRLCRSCATSSYFDGLVVHVLESPSRSHSTRHTLDFWYFSGAHITMGSLETSPTAPGELSYYCVVCIEDIDECVFEE
ncbi:unnamed protein product [Arctogadus glacialis]